MNENEVYKKLRAPFHIRFVNWKINNYNSDKTRALITFYLDARAVQHRLNQVLGVSGWSFTFSELEKDEGVHGKLTVFFKPDKTSGQEEQYVFTRVTREDVGYPNPANKEEWYKDSVSDALKRCAVHFGVGHFLYALPHLWIDLTTPSQKFLNKDQDKYIAEWLQDHIDRMTAKKSSS